MLSSPPASASSIGPLASRTGGGVVSVPFPSALLASDDEAGSSAAAYYTAKGGARATYDGKWESWNSNNNHATIFNIEGEAISKLSGEVITHLEILPGVKNIPHYAFGLSNRQGFQPLCPNLLSVTLPEGLKVIGKCVFAHTKLKSVTFPNSMRVVQIGAFQRCDSLESVVFNKGLKSLGKFAFLGCTSLKSVVFHAGLESIGECAFNDCTSLSSILLPDPLTFLSATAFSGCTALGSLCAASGHATFESYIRFRSAEVLSEIRRREAARESRYAVVACIDRITAEVNANGGASNTAGGKDAIRERVQAEAEKDEHGEDTEGGRGRNDGILRGARAYQMITSADLWRVILEYV